MSVSNNFPTQRPSLDLNFARTKKLDPRITFTRTTTATYYDGVTTAKAEENLLLYSQEFDNWSKIGVTVTANDTTAPNGTLTADTLVEFTNNGSHETGRALPPSANTNFAFSVFAKAKELNTISFGGYGTGGSRFLYDFALTGSGSFVSRSSFGGVTSLSAEIYALNDGWYRCVVNFNSGSASSLAMLLFLVKSGSISYQGDGTSGIYIWGAQVEQRSSVTAYTPTTTQPITNYIPVLLTAPAGVARFDHNPTTGESLGLLIEEQRTNLYLRSQDGSFWSSSAGVTKTINTYIAPDGTLSGTTFSCPSSFAGFDAQAGAFSLTTGTLYTISFYIKHISGSTALRIAGGGLSYNFNPTTDGVDVGNGWRRISTPWTSDRNGNFVSIFSVSEGTTFALWGLQLEAGAFPTSYIKTEGSTVTRNADAASMTGTNFSSWYRADEGTVYCEASTSLATLSPTPWAIFSLPGDNRFQQFYSGTTAIFNRLRANGVNYDTAALAAPLAGFRKFSLAFQVSSAATNINGGAPTTSTPATLPVVTTLSLGNDSANSSNLNGTIRKISFYPTRLTNAQLQALTSL
jgi:hypothetical protein